MYRVEIAVPCENAGHARGIKRILDYALAGLYYNKEVKELLSSAITADEEDLRRERSAGNAVDRRKQMRLVARPSRNT